MMISEFVGLGYKKGVKPDFYCRIQISLTRRDWAFETPVSLVSEGLADR
jgi:hypothetical protein